MKTNLVFWQFFNHPLWLKGLFTLSILGLCLLVACKDDTISPDIPIVVVGDVTDITNDGATFHGQIINEGPGFNELGFIWAESGTPGYESSRKVLSVEKGIRHFSARIPADHQSGKEYTVKSYLKTGDKFTFSNAVKFTSKGSLPPVISSFSPTSGSRGSEVFIKGKNFSAVTSHIRVNFGEFNATILSSTDSTILVKLPDVISVSNVVKVVITVSGNVGTSEESFKFIGPVIESISSIGSNCNDILVIQGSGFTSGGKPEVIFPWNDQSTEGYSALIKSYSDTLIETFIPGLWEDFNNYIVVKSGWYYGKSKQKFIYHSARIESVTSLVIKEGDTLSILGGSFKDILTVTLENTSNSNLFYYLEIIDYSSSLIRVKIPRTLFQGEYRLALRTACTYVNFLPLLELVSPWKQIKDLPFEVLAGTVSAVLGNSVFVGLGFTNCGGFQAIQDFWEYNLETGEWIKRARFPGETRSDAKACVLNGKIMVGGGRFTNGSEMYHTDFWLFDPESNTWKQLSSLPAYGRPGPLMFEFNGKVYYGLGMGYWQDIYEYDPNSDNWSAIKNFPLWVYKHGHSIFFKYNDKVYYVLKTNSDYPPTKLFEFDLLSFDWTEIADVPYNIANAISSEDKVIYVLDNSEIYWIEPSTWQVKTSLPSSLTFGTRANEFQFIYTDRFYNGFGRVDGSNGCQSDMIYLDLNDYK